MKELILGGMRSGKSRLAEQYAIESQLPVTYIATATASDDEMQQRIKKHQSRRPDHWSVVEEPLLLLDTLCQHAAQGHCLLVDCLTLWLSNLYARFEQPELDQVKIAKLYQQLAAAIPQLPGRIIFVSNEIGMGIIPNNALARQFGDSQGELNQAIAQHCERVILCIAGIPHSIKDTTTGATT